MKWNDYFIILGIIGLIMSCNKLNLSSEDDQQNNSDDYQLINKKLLALDELQLMYGNKNNKPYKFKIVVYFNGMCHTCISKMLQWKNILSSSGLGKKVKVFFITYTEEKEILTYYFERDKILHPVYYDFDSTFIIKNKLINITHLAMVVDSTNKIIFASDPLESAQAKGEFLDTLSIINNL